MAGGSAQHGGEEAPPEVRVAPVKNRPDLVRRAHEANRAAWATYQSADYATTLHYATAALEAARGAGERVVEAEALSHLGHVHAGLGDYTTALGLQQQSVAILRELGHLAGLPRPMAGLANLYGALGDFEAQRLVFEEALGIAREIGDEQGVASALVGLGVAWLDGGHPKAAADWLRRGTEVASRIGFSMVEGVGYDHLARALAQGGDLNGALELHRRALELAQHTGNRKGEARQRQRLGSVLIRQGRPWEAVAELARAGAQARTLGLPRLTEEIHAAQSEAFESLGEWREALGHLQAQLALERARLSEEARQRVGVLSAQTRTEWAQREAEHLRRQAEALTHLAHHDPLTGLANRAGVTAHLAGAAERAREGGRPFAVLFLDLDGFKAVNDTLGHDAGDVLLAEVARAFAGVLPPGALLGRIGGDEFTVCAPGASAEGAEALARRLSGALSRPFTVEGQDVFVTVSIGISLCPDDGEAPETLLRRADLAMYGAKRAGKNASRRYAPEMQGSARSRLLIEGRLRGALGRREFRLHYQPQLDIHSGRIVGMEALLRWFPDPHGPPVPPGDFVPAAEDSGLIVPVGAWVLDQACAQLAAWQRGGHPNAHVAVNVSPVQFARSDFVATVRAALEEHGVAPHTLELELTERVVVQDLDFTARQCAALRDLGVRIALDDFGAGESNLGRLLRLPFDVLKLDRDLVRALADSPEAVRVVHALRALAQALGLEVVAEGVEQEAQLRAAEALECHRAQGYLFGRPAPHWPEEGAAPIADFFPVRSSPALFLEGGSLEGG